MAKKKPSTKKNWTHHLITLANTVAALPDTEDLSTSEMRLIHAITHLVSHGSDRPIIEALEYLDGRQAYEAVSRLAFWAEDAASTLELTWPSGSTIITGELTSFLVPLILISSGTTAIPLTVPLARTMDRLATSFRQHGMVGPNPTVLLLPGLYRLYDLPTAWSERRQWLHHLLAAAQHQTSALPSASPESVGKAISPDVTTIHLRFLVGAIISNEDQDNSVWDTSEPLAETDAVIDKLNEWGEDVAELLQNALPGITVSPGVPGLWQDALDNGIELWNIVRLDIEWTNYHRQTAASPDQVLVDIRWNASEEAWQIAFVTAIQTGPSWIWMGRGDPMDHRQDLLEALRKNGFTRFSLDETDCP